MSIKISAYDAAVTNSTTTKKVEDAIEKANLSGALQKEHHESLHSDLDFSYSLVRGGDTFSDHIPFFSHPILYNTNVKDKHGQYVKELALDVRNFGQLNSATGEFYIRNKPEYEWAINRLVLNAIWLKERPDLLRDISIIPAQVYSALISEVLAKRFALDQLEQSNIAILSCYYYLSNFTNEATFDEMEFEKIKAIIGRATKMPSDLINDVLSFEPVVMNSLEFLCETIKAKSNTPALDHLNVGMLISLVSGLWYGHNSREIISVGLDHPPTWIMITYASLFESNFKKSFLSKTSARFDKGGAGDLFQKAVKALLNTYANEDLFDFNKSAREVGEVDVKDTVEKLRSTQTAVFKGVLEHDFNNSLIPATIKILQDIEDRYLLLNALVTEINQVFTNDNGLGQAKAVMNIYDFIKDKVVYLPLGMEEKDIDYVSDFGYYTINNPVKGPEFKFHYTKSVITLINQPGELNPDRIGEAKLELLNAPFTYSHVKLGFSHNVEDRAEGTPDLVGLTAITNAMDRIQQAADSCVNQGGYFESTLKDNNQQVIFQYPKVIAQHIVQEVFKLIEA